MSLTELLRAWTIIREYFNIIFLILFILLFSIFLAFLRVQWYVVTGVILVGGLFCTALYIKIKKLKGLDLKLKGIPEKSIMENAKVSESYTGERVVGAVYGVTK